jgi:hypothetical protein
MTSEVKKVTYSYNNDVEVDELGKFVTNEFLEYKKLTFTQSDHNFITPNELYQEQNVSLNSLFGRDRVFDYPQRLFTDIHFENLTHVHVDKDNIWDLNEKQWFCRSQYSIVYSGFKVQTDHVHLVIHDLLLNTDGDPDFNAHDFYNESDIEYYLDSAAFYRENFKT